MPDLYFTLRATESEKLNKGYWFWGNNDTHLYFSFWQGTVKGLPAVCFHIDNKGTATLSLFAEENENSYSFFEKLAKILGNFQQRKTKISAEKDELNKLHNGLKRIWVRKYEKGTWKENIGKFIAEEKQKIDLVLDFFETQKVGVFKAIRQEVFLRNLAQIERIKRKPHTQEQKIKYYPLHLQAITLNNISHFSEISLNLSKRVTVLIGENGSGKSTILRAIALGLTGINALSNPEYSFIEESELKNLLKIVSIDKQKVFADIGTIQLDYQLDKTYCNEIEFRQTNNEIVISDLGDDESFKSLSGTEIVDFCIGFPQGGNFGLKSFSEENSPNVLDLLPLIANQATNFLRKLEQWLILQYDRYTYSLKDNKKEEAKNAIEQINTVFRIISKVVADDENSVKFQDIIIVNSIKSVIVKTLQAPQGILLGLLSQGYNNLFYWIGGIVSRAYQICEYYAEKYPYKKPATVQEISGIVLIDEIDTYLHPKWQRNILKVLVEEFPKLQFVVTTHSAGVISNINPNIEDGVSIYMIKNGDGKEYDFNNLNTYGMDITNILTNKSLFNEPEYPEPINTKIKVYQSLLERLKNNEARTNPTLFIEVENMHNMLLQDLAQEHPVIIRGNMLMNLKRPQ